MKFNRSIIYDNPKGESEEHLGIRISKDGCGRCQDNIWVERL